MSQKSTEKFNLVKEGITTGACCWWTVALKMVRLCIVMDSELIHNLFHFNWKLKKKKYSFAPAFLFLNKYYYKDILILRCYLKWYYAKHLSKFNLTK